MDLHSLVMQTKNHLYRKMRYFSIDSYHILDPWLHSDVNQILYTGLE